MFILAAVVVNYCDWRSTEKCIESLRTCKTVNKIVIVDNASPNESYERLSLLQEDDYIYVLQAPTNGGYGAGNNFGARYAIEKLFVSCILILNPDVIIKDSAVKTVLAAFSRNPEYKVLAPRVEDESGITRDQGWGLRSYLQELLHMSILTDWTVKYLDSPQGQQARGVVRYDCISGACLFIQAAAFVESGGYDESMFLFYEENLLGQEMRKLGYKTGIVPTESYYHLHSKTINSVFPSLVKKRKILDASREIYLSKYYDLTWSKKVCYQFFKALGSLDFILIAVKRAIVNREFSYVKLAFRDCCNLLRRQQQGYEKNS